MCYTQDLKPLIQKSNSYYYCPIFSFKLSESLYQHIDEIVQLMLKFQDPMETSYNLWSLLSGTARPKYKASSKEGKRIQELGEKIKEDIRSIVHDSEFD
jgi:hypothetical protein